jgi:hypothetical protein
LGRTGREGTGVGGAVAVAALVVARPVAGVVEEGIVAGAALVAGAGAGEGGKESDA